MPNAGEHMTYSGIAAGITYMAMCRHYNRRPTLGEAATCVGAGVIGGIAPDVLEPALHPHHRQFCHSLTVGGVLVKAGDVLCGDCNQDWTEFAKIITACTIVGYVVHLVLDGCTPRGLPLIGT